MSKKTSRRETPNIGANIGIIDGIKNQINIKEIEVPIQTKEEKFKRSYMLTENRIKKIHLMKADSPRENLTEIVSEAIDLLYKKRTGRDEVEWII